ncbi:MAG: MFS transporter [Flavobacterium sp. BFFFF2]|nr:MAG: MFS transporter [Flavobacterium sp. BFFFF2]
MEQTDIIRFKGKYPPQLWSLFFSEMWERFCFYGMRGMLVFFMVHQLKLDETLANLQYGATQAWVYAFTFIGGLFADKLLGFRKSLFWGGLLMIAGSVILAIDPVVFFFPGISFTIVGTGFFKPNISSMVGQLYAEDDPRRDAGFSLFYAGVNLGALIGGYLCVAVGKGDLMESMIPVTLRWNVAFGFAAFVMVISLLTFTQTQKKMGSIGLSPILHWDKSKRKMAELATYVGSLMMIPIVLIMVSKTAYTDVFMAIIGPASIVYLLYEMRSFNIAENKKLLAALLLMLFSIFFWAFFEQSGGSLSLFAADYLHSTFAGVPLDPNGVNNAANSLFVILFAAVLGIIWLALSKKRKEPSIVVKFGLGFLFLAGGFWVFSTATLFFDATGKTSLEWFTFGWFIITFGELCLSPIGMSAMTKLSPQKTQGLIMGMWFLASAYGQYFAGLLGADIAQTAQSFSPVEKFHAYTDSYGNLSLYALVAGIILIALHPIMKKLTMGIK